MLNLYPKDTGNTLQRNIKSAFVSIDKRPLKTFIKHLTFRN